MSFNWGAPHAAVGLLRPGGTSIARERGFVRSGSLPVPMHHSLHSLIMMSCLRLSGALVRQVSEMSEAGWAGRAGLGDPHASHRDGRGMALAPSLTPRRSRYERLRRISRPCAHDVGSAMPHHVAHGQNECTAK